MEEDHESKDVEGDAPTNKLEAMLQKGRETDKKIPTTAKTDPVVDKLVKEENEKCDPMAKEK